MGVQLIEFFGKPEHDKAESHPDKEQNLGHAGLRREREFQENGGYDKAGIPDDDGEVVGIEQGEQQDADIAENEEGVKFVEEDVVEVDPGYGNPAEEGSGPREKAVAAQSDEYQEESSGQNFFGPHKAAEFGTDELLFFGLDGMRGVHAADSVKEVNQSKGKGHSSQIPEKRDVQPVGPGGHPEVGFAQVFEKIPDENQGHDLVLLANVDGGGPAQVIDQEVHFVYQEHRKRGVNGIDRVGE